MTAATGALIDAVDWSTLHSSLGAAEFVPEAFRQLIDAQSEEEAEEAYWKLDNRVVVQGQLYDSARWLIGPLVAALQGSLTDSARNRVAELLAEIAIGAARDIDSATGDIELALACREELSRGLWSFYGLLDDNDHRTRLGATYILEVVEPDKKRLTHVMNFVVRLDPEEAMRGRAIALLREIESELD